MKIKLLVFMLLCSFFNFGQESRTLLKGRLLYRNSNVIAANVINNTAQSNTITDGEGGFEISVRVGDELVFSSVQYKIRSVKITPEIIKLKRLVVSIDERINVLDEVVVGPENQQKFLDMKKEEFKRVDYTQDKSTKLINRAADDRQLANGINFVNVAKLLIKVLSYLLTISFKVSPVADLYPWSLNLKPSRGLKFFSANFINSGSFNLLVI